MKRPILTLAALLAALLMSHSAFAIPETVTYTGYLESADLEPISDTLEMSFRVYADASGGEPIWSQASRPVQVSRGQFHATLEDISVALDEDQVWLEVTIADETLSPRTRVDSVPFALRAADAETVGGLTAAELQMGGSPDLTPLLARLDELEGRVAELEAMETRVAQLEELTSDVSITNDADGNRTLLFEAVNVQLVNGTGDTLTENGLGNLVLGYNERPEDGETPVPDRIRTTSLAILLLLASASCESAGTDAPLDEEDASSSSRTLSAGPASVSTSSSYRLSGSIRPIPAQQTSASFRLSPAADSAD